MSRRSLTVALERGLLALGVGCLGVYAAETIEAQRFRSEQKAAFASAAHIAAAATRGGVLPVDITAGHDVANGALLGMLEVPRLRLNTPVVQGDDDATLDVAVGHLPDTPLPWEGGNSALAGHRDGLFRPLRHIRVGDRLTFRTPVAEIRYRVTATAVVDPADVSVLQPRERDALTLITCYPFTYVGPAPERFVVHAERE